MTVTKTPYSQTQPWHQDIQPNGSPPCSSKGFTVNDVPQIQKHILVGEMWVVSSKATPCTITDICQMS